jgi:hypothetical protein
MRPSDQDAAQTTLIFVPKYPDKSSDVNPVEYNMVKGVPASNNFTGCVQNEDFTVVPEET